MATDFPGSSILEISRAAARELTSGGNPTPHRRELQMAYEAALSSPAAQKAEAETNRLFSLVTTLTPADQPALRVFAKNWGGETHVSSDLVGLLARRLHHVGAHSAAGDMMEVIAEDIGSKGSPHRDIYATFANSLCTPAESWRAPELANAECKKFRKYLSDARTKAPLEEALLTTAASEILNVGEYTTAADKFAPWLKTSMKLSEKDGSLKRANFYSKVHSGKTELDHFLYAIDAGDKLAAHTNTPQSAELAARIMEKYLTEIAKAYKGLTDAITRAIVAPQRAIKDPGASFDAIKAMPGGIR